ncbi:MAG TPA: YcjX family protein [Hyphomicrobiaceae bacterium]|nr:YcjX family protein [Hyphomicrobiaceae bacterium]
MAAPEPLGITESALGALRSAGDYLADLVTPTLRLGVTGLARSGKTVFITALVRNLIEGGRLPFFSVVAEGRLVRAFLEPQPDDAVPRFAYEDHLAALARTPPSWPESTRRISQLRVTVEYLPRSRLRRSLGPSRLHIDIVDYPGEWLLDLALIDLSYRQWSRAAVELASEPHHQRAAAAWLAYTTGIDAAGPEDEQVALKGSGLYADYLQAARNCDPPLSTLGPGRLLMPGDLAGSPLLTFMPLVIPEAASPRRGSMFAMMERRYQAYKSHVVMPFFRDHFSRLDRQIVLVDALAALNAGEAGLVDVERALGAVLAPFKPGSAHWLLSLITRRIDRILFAAAKADHVHHTSHQRLENVLARITARAAGRATLAGAEIKLMAVAALRATREAEVKRADERLPVVVGTPLPGERIAGETFDGSRPAAIFPGDLPLTDAVQPGATPMPDQEVRVVRFRPPHIPLSTSTGEPAAWPHIRLDRALEFLLGDRLA